jgi:hypothetical protein
VNGYSRSEFVEKSKKITGGVGFRAVA